MTRSVVRTSESPEFSAEILTCSRKSLETRLAGEIREASPAQCIHANFWRFETISNRKTVTSPDLPIYESALNKSGKNEFKHYSTREARYIESAPDRMGLM